MVLGCECLEMLEYLWSDLMKLANIKILGTGGTLASVASSPLSSDYDSAAIKVEDLLKDIPGVDKLANLSSEQVVQINSENMTESVWLKLAKRVQHWVDDDSVDGIVITHGTDTMEETAYFLNLVINTKKPIVLTGAMRPANAVSADGLKNLYNAIVLAAHPESFAKGVLVTLNDVIHHARDVTKTNVSTVDAFESPELGILGYVHDDTIHYYREEAQCHTYASEFSIQNLVDLPKVHIIYGYVGSTAAMVKACVADKAKGIISAGVGRGYQSEEVSKALIQAREQGVIIVRCSRVRNGIIPREADLDDKYDYVISNMLNPQKARILLTLALSKYQDTQSIQDIFERY